MRKEEIISPPNKDNLESEKNETDPEKNKRTCPFSYKLFYNKENVEENYGLELSTGLKYNLIPGAATGGGG